MSVLHSIADRILKYQEEQSHDRYPYLVKEGSNWVIKENVNGCRPVNVQASVLMDKNPPPLPGDLMPRRPASPRVPPNSTAAKTQSFTGPKRDFQEACTPAPPPFDMLDIPAGMEHMGFHYAAYLARRWFNGRAYLAPTDSSAIFNDQFVDTESLKLSWILSFGKVRRRYEHLLSSDLAATEAENIFNQKAKENLLQKFQQFMRQQRAFSGTLDTLTLCGNDRQALHQNFQFQLVNVSVADALGKPTVVMNDLTASLANFSIFAAVALAKISNARYNRYDTEPWRRCSHAKVKITHVYIYAKDSYSFNDNADGGTSQYLGHWNQHGVIIAVKAALAELLSKFTAPQLHYESGNEPRMYLPPLPQHLDKAVDSRDRLRAREVFYPVRNQSFRAWREAKGRGGDFLVWSNLERIKLSQPIELDLGEVCQ